MSKYECEKGESLHVCMFLHSLSGCSMSKESVPFEKASNHKGENGQVEKLLMLFSYEHLVRTCVIRFDCTVRSGSVCERTGSQCVSERVCVACVLVQNLPGTCERLPSFPTLEECRGGFLLPIRSLHIECVLQGERRERKREGRKRRSERKSYERRQEGRTVC